MKGKEKDYHRVIVISWGERWTIILIGEVVLMRYGVSIIYGRLRKKFIFGNRRNIMGSLGKRKKMIAMSVESFNGLREKFICKNGKARMFL